MKQWLVTSETHLTGRPRNLGYITQVATYKILNMHRRF